MKDFLQPAGQEQINLIKCLECRLLAPPPIFDMPPPPPLSPELIDILRQESTFDKSGVEPRRVKMSPSQKKRCLKFKNILISRNIIPAQSAKAAELAEHDVAVVKSNDAKLTGDRAIINLTTNQSMILFLACFLVFLVVLTVAFVLLAKLFRIRKQLKTSKVTIEHKNRHHHLPKLSCLSSSISSSSSSSTASTTSSSANHSNQSKSSTINSQLILTPSSSLLAEKPQLFASNLLRPQVDQTGNLMMPTFYGQSVDHYDMTMTSNAAAMAANSYICYNQLFASTKPQQFKLQASSVHSYKSNDDQQLYLQAVTNPNNKLNIIVADAEISSSPSSNDHHRQAPSNAGTGSLDEYAEINSQLYLYGAAPSNVHQNIYNQFDDESSTRLKSNSTSSCSTTSSSVMMQPYSSTAEAPFILNLNGNKFLLLNNQPLAFITQQHVPAN